MTTAPNTLMGIKKIREMKKDLKQMISKDTWKQFSLRLQKEETVDVLHKLFDHIVNSLISRIDAVKTEDGRAISFFNDAREFLTINITCKDLRIYIHPTARVIFDPKEGFKVERFNFWKGSYRKTSAKYTGISIWISKNKYLEEVKKIIDRIPKSM